MKLDNDCIRDILLFLEEKLDIKDDNGDTVIVPIESLIDNFKNKYSEKQIMYTTDKIKEGGFIKTCCHRYVSDNSDDIMELTYDGHLYLANIRDNQIWNIVKNKTKGLASVSFGIMVELAKEEIKQKLNFN